MKHPKYPPIFQRIWISKNIFSSKLMKHHVLIASKETSLSLWSWKRLSKEYKTSFSSQSKLAINRKTQESKRVHVIKTLIKIVLFFSIKLLNIWCSLNNPHWFYLCFKALLFIQSIPMNVKEGAKENLGIFFLIKSNYYCERDLLGVYKL